MVSGTKEFLSLFEIDESTVHFLVPVVFNNEEIDSMLPCVCSVIDHR